MRLATYFSSSSAIGHIDVSFGPFPLFRLGEHSKHLSDGGDNGLLLFVIETLSHILDNGVESSNGSRTEVDDHDYFSLGKVVRAEAFKELRDRVLGVSEGSLAERVGMSAHVLKELLTS